MLKITVITVGSLSEAHWKDAAAEYKKRLTGKVSLTDLCLKDERLPQSPSDAEIARALDAEADRIIASIPKRATVVPLCVEGKQITSEALAAKIDTSAAETGEICFISTRRWSDARAPDSFATRSEPVAASSLTVT